ncbi:MAG: nucleotidyltransferase family protein [Polyangiaceae bacterium]|nr:nucleotidyltransferase family protein [Polyangiaceae bacterium]
MKCVVLAAGYATRLHPLTLNTPKPLLEVGGQSILDHLLSNLVRVPDLTEIVLVSNARFLEHFRRWQQAATYRVPVSVLDDGSTTNETRLGAVADLALAVSRSRIADDCLVTAADNLFTFELADFAAFFRRARADAIAVHELTDLARLRRTGVVEIAEDSRVLSFEEKPALPKSRWAAPPLYVYRADTLPLVGEYLDAGHDPDAPGNFVPWLLGRRPVVAFRFSGPRYDIGDRASYEAAKLAFARGGEASGP